MSERAAFAQKVLDAGLVWIGPPPSAIDAMGDKIDSRRRMVAAGVPCVPGLTEPMADPAAGAKFADEIGFPICIKASAGGGGKGIRVVRERGDLTAAFKAASSEALASFGDGRVYLERYLDQPRHVEVQVLFDAHGHGVHLYERECSIQRRHQKLIEEAPSVVIDDKTRAAMGEVALKAARAVGYVSAGTIEFLWSKGEFYFLEMNTRLQVEHPVTEMITGIDLVREQLRVAAGEKLGYTQADIPRTGHAIEVRINAENPFNGFLPSTGTISNLRIPGGPWTRLDSAMYRGMEVGLSYDPMLAKLIVWGPDRAQAIARMVRAIQETNVGGVHTGLPAALQVLQHPEFQAGRFDTHFLESLKIQSPEQYADLVAIGAAIHRHRLAKRRALDPRSSERGGWVNRARSEVSDYVQRAGVKEVTQ